jgi:hypothetical protein
METRHGHAMTIPGERAANADRGRYGSSAARVSPGLTP